LCQDVARMRRGRRKFALSVALALIAAACHSSRPVTAPPSTTTTTSTTVAVTTTTVDPTDAAILAAYIEHWNDVIAVDTVYPVAPLDPRIGDHAIGKQLTGERMALTHLSVLGHFERGTTEFHPVVTSIDGSTARISDCLLDHSVEVDHKTDLPVESPDIGHTLDDFTMTRFNGAWFVSDSTVIGSGKGGDACTPSVG
jgi:hypothetical protein